MKQKTIVIVSGGYGVGKTRLVNQLLGDAGPDARVAAVVQQTGPVNLDPLWLPGIPVVAMDEGCACGGGGELLDCLRLLQEREYELVGVELTGDQEATPLKYDLAGLDGVEVIAVAAGEVGDDTSLEALREHFGVTTTERGAPGAEGDEHEHGEGCGCGHHDADGTGHHHGGCVCAERRVEPQWMPFWFVDGVREARLIETLEGLPEAVIRVKGLMRLDEDRWLRVDRAAGVVNHQVITKEMLPQLYDLESLTEGEPMDSTPPDGGAILVWTRAEDEVAGVTLEWEVARALADCFEVHADPDTAASFAMESLGDEALVFEALTSARMAAMAALDVPEHAELLAKYYHELQENEHAMVMLREATRRDPAHLSSRLNSARLHLSYEEIDEACALAEAAVADAPEDPEARALYGEALVMLGRLDEAVEHLEAAAIGLPDDDVLRSTLCNLFAERGDYQRALAYNSEVLSLDPEDDGALYLRGELLLRLDRNEDAADVLDQALAAGNESPWVMTALGIAHVRCGNEPEAAGCFADAFVLSQEQLAQLPDDSSAVDLLLAAAFRGRLDQIPDLFSGLAALNAPELAKARDTLSLAPEQGEAQRTMDAIDEILQAD